MWLNILYMLLNITSDRIKIVSDNNCKQKFRRTPSVLGAPFRVQNCRACTVNLKGVPFARVNIMQHESYLLGQLTFSFYYQDFYNDVLVFYSLTSIRVIRAQTLNP
jgi:hypothetical protein